MDNEALMDQIVRSLSFEVIAVPQGVIQVDETSKSTPLNVKIRVRKKDDAGLRHGVLSMPKVERKDNQPHRVRLVSSDQTIMSFNVVMEADFDKMPPKHRIQNLNLVIPDKEEYPPLSKIADDYNGSPILSKRNKDIFGRCKPGGCLDPPFGEEKYSYRPPPQNLSLPNKDDTTKLRTSSIFKNKIFKRTKKSSQDEGFSKNDTKTEADPVLSLYESGSLQVGATRSNSIITYSHDNVSSSSKLRLQGERANRNRYSSEDRSKYSVSEGSGSYFILPKKTKNLVEQREPEFKNILRTTIDDDDDLKNISYKPTPTEKDELKYTSKIPAFIPIPLLTAMHSDRMGTTEIQDQSEIKTISQTELLEPRSDENKDHDAVNLNCEISPDEILTHEANSTLREQLPLNYVDDVTHTDSTNAPHDMIKTVENDVEDQLANQKTIEIIPSFDKIMDENVDLSVDVGENTDIKSHPLVPTRYGSLLDVTTDNENDNRRLNHEDTTYSTEDLKHIWKNNAEPLKSAADVITENTLPSKKSKEMLLDVPQDEKTLLATSPYDSIKMQSLEDEMKKMETSPMTKLETESDVPPKTEMLGNSDYYTQENMTDNIDIAQEKQITADLSSLAENSELNNKSSQLDMQSPKARQRQITIDDFVQSKVFSDKSSDSDFGNVTKEGDISTYRPDKNLTIDSDEVLDMIDFGEDKIISPDTVKSITEKENLLENIGSELAAEFKDIGEAFSSPLQLGQFLSDDSTGVLHKSPQPNILRNGIVPWKVDIALQSYIDENNERVIKSFESTKIPGRRPNDALLVAQCSLESESNEIKIPIDLENELCVQIRNNKSRCIPVVTDLNENTITTDESRTKKKIRMNLPVGPDPAAESTEVDYNNVHMSEANKHNKMISDDKRDVLAMVYEQELVPLQYTIKGLREEIDMLVAYQMKFRESVHKLAPNRSRPIRLVAKKCSCVKRL